MSAPLLWIVLPAVVGLALWLLRSRERLLVGLASGVCFALAGMAWLFPIGQPVDLIFFGFQIDPSLDFAGRRLILENPDRPFLTFFFLFAALWFLGSAVLPAQTGFVPFGLGVLALLVAALAVEPFLYAALLVEMAVLLCVPLLVPPGRRFGQGVLRFLIFQTLALPFILLAGWALSGVEASPTNITYIQLATVFLGLGFAFWLAVFPFYTWIPLLAEQSYPYVTGFLLFFFPMVNLLLGQSFLNGFAWMRAAPEVYTVIGLVGLLMIVTAGVWAAFQQDMARLLGYAVIVETGFSLLATGRGGPLGQELFSALFLPRVIALGVWALALSILLGAASSTRFQDMQGVSQRMPYASAALAVSALTLAGLPLFSTFPIRLALLEGMAAQSFFSAAWALAGMVGMLFSTFRALSVLVRGRAGPQVISETRLQIFFLVGGMVSMLLVGLVPRFFFALMRGLVAVDVPLP